jgi:serine/threonine protein kinase
MNPQASPMLNSADSPDAAGQPASPAGNRRFLYAGGMRPFDGYTIKRGVGQGGFGEIYYAVSDSGKEVALKLVRRNLDVELRGIRQCLNLKHPNLLHLFDIRQDDNGDTWVVMEYVGGMSLQDAVDAQPSGMPLDEALAWIHGIAAAVAYLHDHGIVHRDLKPANIFSDDGVVKVGDYGLSKFISCSRRSGHTESIGTVHYMAPEVANGRYGKELDVYALGIILFEMLTGRVPFDGESVGEVLMKHLTAQANVSELPEPYRTIAAKAMEKDPEKRYRSANEFLAALPPPTAVSPGTSRLPPGSRAPKAFPPEAEKIEYVLPVEDKIGEKTAHATTIASPQSANKRSFIGELGESCRPIGEKWKQLHPAVQVVIALGMVFLLLAFGRILIPLGLLVAIAVGIAVVINWFVSSWVDKDVASAPQPPPELAKTVAAPNAASPAARPITPSIRDRNRWRRPYEKSLPALVLRTPRERLTDLLGSLLFATLISAMLTVVMAFLLAFLDESPKNPKFISSRDNSGALRLIDNPNYNSLQLYSEHTTQPEHLAWLFFMTTVGSWAVLVPAKFWEGTKGEALLRRLVMAFLGMGLGGLAFVTASFFNIALPQLCWGAWHNPIPSNFYASGSQPLLPAFVIVFSILFFVMRWWRNADPLRSTRLNVFSFVVTVLLSGVIGGFFHFPYPWIMMLAGAIFITVQLSSPWIPPRERAAMRNK